MFELGSASVGASLIETIATIGRRRPEAPAVCCGTSVLTYGALDRLANGLAHAIDGCGGDDGAPVALFLEAGVAVAVGTLAAGKARRPWVQLHPRHPEARNAFLLRDLGAGAIVTDRAGTQAARRLAARAAPGAAVVVVDEVEPRSRFDALAWDAAATAVIKYTSGSTGEPKGVCLSVGTVRAAATSHMAAIGLHAADRLASLVPLLSHVCHYGALLHGAAECLYDVQRCGIEGLADWLTRERITVLVALPTVFRRLIRSVAPDRRFPAVRVVWLYGEAATGADLDDWRIHFPAAAALRVSLGATEAFGIAAGSFTRDAVVEGGVLPMRCGRGVRIVGADGAPVAAGAVGRIEVRGAGVFSSYWRNPVLTAAALRPDPHAPDARIFRSGDLGRVLPDGRFFHAGRLDRQVKVAGNRVDAAEVEHAVRRLPGVRDAAVVATARGGAVRLVAFCVPSGAPLAGRALRAQLATALPSAMIPSAFVMVDALPTLDVGKIDYAALAAAVDGRMPVDAPPRHPVDEALLASWQRILGRTDVGIHDDLMLDLGGDSLAAVQVLAEVAALFGRELPLAVFHEASTVSALADRLLDDGWRPPVDGRLVLHAAGRRPPLFAICGAYGHALRLLVLGRGLDPDQPFIGLQPPGMDWDGVGCRTIEAMAAHYATAIRNWSDGPCRLLGTSLGGVLAFETARALRRGGVAVELVAMVDTALPTCRGPAGVERTPSREFVAGNPGVPLIADGMRVARQHQSALRRYVLDQPFDGDVLYFRCAESHDPTTAARRGLWRRYVGGAWHEVEVPGRHGEFHRDPQRAAVVAALRAALG